MKETKDPTCLLHLGGKFYDRSRDPLTRSDVDKLLASGTPVLIYPIVLEQRVYTWDEYKTFHSPGHYQGGRALGVIKSIIDKKKGIVGVLYDDQDDIVEERLRDVNIDQENTPLPAMNA